MIIYLGRTLEEYALLEEWADSLELKSPAIPYGSIAVYLRWLDDQWTTQHPTLAVTALNLARIMTNGK